VESTAVGFNGTDYLVAWQESVHQAIYEICAARLTPQGAVLDSPGIVVSGWGETAPAVTSDGTNFLVVWCGTGGGMTSSIFGARVSSQGKVLDTSRIEIAPGGIYAQTLPKAVFDGTNYLVAWQTEEGSGDIHAARVTPQGVVLDGEGTEIIVCKADGNQGSPAVCPDGAGTLVMWHDGRSGMYHHIYWAHVTTGGKVSDNRPVVIQEGDQWYPALARGTGGRMLLAYSGWTGLIGGKPANTMRTWAELGAFTGLDERTPRHVASLAAEPTIIRGVLYLKAVSGQPSAVRNRAVLLDITGRKAFDLHPGPNDVSRLAPGVYFVRSQPQASSFKPQAIWKVVLTK
jgi:hypothetical protein